jgi:hypothetical protein
MPGSECVESVIVFVFVFVVVVVFVIAFDDVDWGKEGNGRFREEDLWPYDHQLET